MLKVIESRYIVPKVKLFRVHLEGGTGFKDDKVVDLLIELVESNFKEIKLGINKEEVIHLSASISSGVGLPPPPLTKLLSLA